MDSTNESAPVIVWVTWDAQDIGVRLIQAISELTRRATADGLDATEVAAAVKYCADRCARSPSEPLNARTQGMEVGR